MSPGDERPILLLGAGGQLGRALAPRLAQLGPVLALSRAEADLESLAALRRLVEERRPRLIVNAAAYTGVDEAERDQTRCHLVNAEAPGVLAEESARLGVPMVHFSTNYVFDGALGRPYRESDATGPLGVYGHTKLEGDERVAAANPRHLILRTSAVYARRGRNFLTRILELAREREELRVVSDQIVSPTPADALAGATVRVLEEGWVGDELEATGLFNLTASGATSFHGFALRLLALDPRREEQRCRLVEAVASAGFPTPARRPLNGQLDDAAFRTRFGFGIPAWEDELARVLAPPAAPDE